MLILILIIGIYLFFSSQNTIIIKNNNILEKINFKLKPYLNNIKEIKEKIEETNNKLKEKMLYDLYEDKLTELENAMTGILLSYPKRFEDEINKYFSSIIDKN